MATDLAAEVTDLEDRLWVLEALSIPTRDPDSLPGVFQQITSAACKAKTP